MRTRIQPPPQLTLGGQEAFELRHALLKAVEIIRIWHDANQRNEKPSAEAWRIYYNHAPEMKELFGPMQRVPRQQPPPQPPPPSASNGRKQRTTAPGAEKPPETFTELVLMALKDVQPARGSEVLRELADSGVPCDQKKVSGTLTYLKKMGRVSFDTTTGKWTREEK